MVKIKNITSTVNVFIVFDNFIPLSICFENMRKGSPLYWRVGNGVSTLLEFEFDFSTSCISGIVLENIKTDCVEILNDRYIFDKNIEVGFPIFDTSHWGDCVNSGNYSDIFLDEFHRDVRMEIGRDYLSIKNLGEGMAVRYIRNEDVIFGFDEKYKISQLDLINISCDNVLLLLSSINE